MTTTTTTKKAGAATAPATITDPAPKSSAALAAEIATAMEVKTEAEKRVGELDAAYRSALVAGTDADAAHIEDDLAVARRQVTRQTVMIEALQQALREAEQREREEAAQARLAALNERRDAMAAEVAGIADEVETVYMAACRTIADFLQRWNETKFAALALEAQLVRAGLPPIPKSRSLFGGRDADEHVPAKLVRWEEWVEPGIRGLQAPTMYTINDKGEQVPMNPAAYKVVKERTDPARTFPGQVHQSAYGFEGLRLPSPRRGERDILFIQAGR